MEEFSFLAPAHNPPYIAAIRAFRQELPGVPLVAVIETGPYRWMDEAATTYAVPYEWREEFGIRRYGFHGASHRSASERTEELLRRTDLRHISCHLGGSSSVAAFRNGIAMDTSFGASPQSGLPQNNRVGDIDVFAVLHMMKKLGLGPDQMAKLLGSQSGLAGISGTSGDLRDLTEAAAAATIVPDSRWMFLCAPSATISALPALARRRRCDHVFGRHRREQRRIRSAVLKNLSAFGIEVGRTEEPVLQAKAPSPAATRQ